MSVLVQKSLETRKSIARALENLKLSLESLILRVRAKIKAIGGEMIGGMEKGYEAAKVASPPKHLIEGVDVRKIAGYVGFKAAMTKNRMTMEIVIAIQFVFVLSLFVYSVQLNGQLRNRALLMVPSHINGVTEVVPNSLPASRIHKAFVHYVGLLGNIDPTSIKEQYSMLKDYMGRDLRIKFQIETEALIHNVLEEGLSEYIKIGEKTVEPDGKGWFRITAPIRVTPHVRGMELKSRSEFVVMKLKIVAPTDKNTWGLEIADLKRMSGSTFYSGQRMKKASK